MFYWVTLAIIGVVCWVVTIYLAIKDSHAEAQFQAWLKADSQERRRIVQDKENNK